MTNQAGFVDLTSSDGHRFSAYMAGPAAANRALVIVQEIFGVNSYIRSVCDSLAARGYRVIAPALFDRATRHYEEAYTAEEARRGMEIRKGFDENLPLEDIKAAALQLGGTMSWRAASRTELFDAAVSWYGTGIAADARAVLHCPMQLHFGNNDHATPLAGAELVHQLRPDVDVHIYQAGHGFGCTERGSYEPAAAKLAWQRTHSFLERHLS